MRCPICNERVRNHDALQLHYLQGCSGLGSSREDNGDEHKEPTENLVEVDFKWMNTKGTFEEKISLVSSLAGQIVLERKSDGEIYQSAKVFVPCGIHCCQLVIADECYPVFDIDIDDAQESLYIIIQADVETSGNEEPTATYPGVDTNTERGQSYRFAGNVVRNNYEVMPRSSDEERMLGGVKQHHQVDPEYAREILRRINSEDSAIENDYPETRRLQNDHDSQDHENGKSNENPFTRVAANDLHEVQIHHSSHENQNNNTRSSHKKQRNNEEKIMVTSGSESGKTPSKSEYFGTETVLDPNESEGSESYLQTGQNRSRSLAQYGGGLGNVGSTTLSDQLAFQESLSQTSRKDIQRKLSDDENQDETGKHGKVSWGIADLSTDVLRENQNKFKDDYSERSAKYKSSRSEPYDKQIQEERVFELQAKCNSYESELTRFRKENEDLIKQLCQMQQEIEVNERKHATGLNNKFDALKHEIKSLKEENESLKTAHTLQVDDLSRINNALIEEVNDLSSKVDNLKFSSKSFQNNDSRKVLQLEAEVSNLKLENNDLKLKLSRIEREFLDSQTDLSRKESREFDKYSSTSFENNNEYFAEKTRYSEPRKTRYSEQSRNSYLDEPSFSVHEPVIKSSYRSRDYDDHTSNRKSLLSGDYEKRQRSPRHDYKFDSDYNHLPNHDLTTTRYKSPSTGHWDNLNDRTDTSVPSRSSRLNKSDSYEPRSSTNDAREHVDIDSILAPSTSQVQRREKKTRRERPHSFHGGVTSSSYFDSSSSNIIDDILTNNRYSSIQKDSSYSSGLDNVGLSTQDKSATCFYPTTPADISVGMRALVTRTSGRLGKGLVKWKGQLPGHSEWFLGIELENPNGKHDGVFDGRRYFQCKRDHGIFAKFSKVVMVWVPRK